MSHPTKGPVKGVLLIHGFTGSPHEFAPIEPALRQAGYQVRRVTLPGHGDTPDRPLHETSVEEILAHCEAEAAQLAGQVDDLHLIGHSLGGACALMTAAGSSPAATRLKGVIAFGAPYEHAYPYNYWHGLARLPIPTLLRGLSLLPQDRFECIRPPCYPWHVPQLLQQSRTLFTMMRERVHRIQVPVHLVHSIYDLMVPYPEMHKLADIIGSAHSSPPPVTLTTLEQSSHRLFPASRDVELAREVILSFLEQGLVEET
jgi:carboxylesterase